MRDLRFVLFVQFVFSKIKRQILPDSNTIENTLIRRFTAFTSGYASVPSYGGNAPSELGKTNKELI